MQLINTKKELRSSLSSRPKTKTIGLVPTMGALHLGHISLIKKSVEENGLTIISIFVNPTQFNNKEDLERYPHTLEADLALLKTVSDDLVVFTPSATEMYSGEIISKTYDFEGLENVMEGEFREGHFDGVGTIVEKLLRLISPTRAYFGEKDFQQLQIIKKLVEKAALPIEIMGCPIVREPNGLAMSSRNERLDTELRQEAGFIYQTLTVAKHKFGTKSANFTIDSVKKQFKDHSKLTLEYVKIADVDQLKPVKRKNRNTKYRAFIAVYAGGVRLIDNIAL